MTEQEVPQGAIIRSMVANVSPAKSQEYETLVSELIKLYKEKKFSRSIGASYSVNRGYLFAISYPNFAAMDEMSAWSQALIQTKEYQDLARRASELTMGSDVWLIRGRPDLHYVPENPRIQPEERLFIRFAYLYIKPGTQDKVDALLKKSGDLRKEHNIGTGAWVGTALTGNNLPYYLLYQLGKSAADFHAEMEKISEKLGDKQQAILNEMRSLLRSSVAVFDYQPRPDLSYTAE